MIMFAKVLVNMKKSQMKRNTVTFLESAESVS